MAFLSKNNKFLFIHIPKNAGSSILEALYSNSRNDLDLLPFSHGVNSTIRQVSKRFRISRLIKNIGPRYFYTYHSTHLPYGMIKHLVPHDCRIMAIVRDPNDYIQSYYNFVYKNKRHPLHRLSRKLSFSKWWDFAISNTLIETQSHFLPQDCINNPFATIVKFENVPAQVPLILSTTFNNDQINLKHINKTSTGKRSKIHNNYSKLFSEYFAEDFYIYNSLKHNLSQSFPS